jgi:hypothetical protein
MLYGCAHLPASVLSVSQQEDLTPSPPDATNEIKYVEPTIITYSPIADTSPTRLFTPTDTNTAPTPAATISKIPSSSPTLEKATPTLTFSLSTLPPLATETRQPNIQDSPIQIFGPGERSKVTTPIQIEAQLSSNGGRLLRIELRGAGGRLLARQVKTPTTIPWSSAKISVKLSYEIRTPAEAGRLTISVDDQHGRTMDLNSVNILLLPTGAAELLPSSALKQVIIIQEPAPGKVIKDGTVLVSGLARTDLRHPLKVELISEDGKILGQRLATTPQSTSESYGVFAAEVPYLVPGLTPARLIIFEDEENRDEITYLSSVGIVLKP